MKRSPLRKGRPYAILAALGATLALTLPLVLTAPGCGLQGEGERCDRNVSATPNDPDTGNDDCDTAAGLFCVSKNDLGSTSDICCPKGASDNPNCQFSGGQGGGSSTSAAVTSAATSTASSSAASTSSTTGAGGAGGGA